eukprot:m.97265 g.97265  ORF g.97265 m.97265 type:complete len:538 (-) comp26961_c0_seq1:140-1753(-)
MVRVRFAPSPTGHLHLGGLRTALFNALFARKHNGKLLLRIEDTDQQRLVPGAARAMEKILNWAGIFPDESPSNPGAYGPYVQSERLSLYQHHTELLVTKGSAYHCFCTTERLQNLRKVASHTNRLTAYDGTCRHLTHEQVSKNLSQGLPSTVRLKTPTTGLTQVEDLVYGNLSFENNAIDDQILMKSSGFPTYHLANVVDDHLMEVTHVLRGEEWLSSTAKHNLLYKAFEWSPPHYAHIPLLINFDRSKLSKRQNDLRVEELKKRGIMASAIINFVAFMGWCSPQMQSEVYGSLDEIAQDFSIEAVSKAPATVDMRKLFHLNKQHQMLMSGSEPVDAKLQALVDVLLPQVVLRYDSKNTDNNLTTHPATTTATATTTTSTSSDTTTTDPYLLSEEHLRKILLTSKGTYETCEEVLTCAYFWTEPEWDAHLQTPFYTKAMKNYSPEILTSVLSELEAIEALDFTSCVVKEAVNQAALKHRIKPGSIMPLLRFCLTAAQRGPSIYDVAEVIGKQKTIDRITRCPTPTVVSPPPTPTPLS